jgi:hypothetical protein
MNHQNELMHSTGEIEPGDHPFGCLCTACTLERQFERDGIYGRYDQHSLVKPHLQRAAELREEIARTPRSTGGAGYKRAEVAGVAEERTVSPSPTVDLKGAA